MLCYVTFKNIFLYFKIIWKIRGFNCIFLIGLKQNVLCFQRSNTWFNSKITKIDKQIKKSKITQNLSYLNLIPQ